MKFNTFSLICFLTCIILFTNVTNKKIKSQAEDKNIHENKNQNQLQPNLLEKKAELVNTNEITNKIKSNEKLEIYQIQKEEVSKKTAEKNLQTTQLRQAKNILI